VGGFSGIGFVKTTSYKFAILWASLFLMGFPPSVSAEVVKPAFLYTLSNFTGPIPYLNWANISVDRQNKEVYVTDPQHNEIAIFDENGMEVYRFGHDENVGAVLDMAVDEKGDIFVLSLKEREPVVVRCDFRGEPQSTIRSVGFPLGFSRFSPDRILYREGRFYLADTGAMRAAVIDRDGSVLKAFDIGSVLVDFSEKEKTEATMVGFSVDKEGRMLFTIPAFFQAFVLSPEGGLTGFGRPGGGPGKFGIVGGIIPDNRGNYVVAETLRSVVMVFDKDFTFQTEFGYRGFRPENLIGPRNLAMDADDRLYVSQVGNRGVSVFKLTYN
jgi:sugar lactone lactonase YvrE